MIAVKKFPIKSCSLCGMKFLRKHKFPTDPKRRKQWINFALRHGLKPNPKSLLCELHFDPVKDYNKSRLKVTAVPTIFKHKTPSTNKIKMMTLRSQHSQPQFSATSKKNDYSSVRNLRSHSNDRTSLGTSKMLSTSSNVSNDFEDSDSPEESEIDNQNSVAQPFTMLPTSSNVLNDFEDSDSPEENEIDNQNSVAQPLTLPTSSNVSSDPRPLPRPIIIKEEIVSPKAGGTNFYFNFPNSTLPMVYNINISQPTSTSNFSFTVNPSSQPTTSPIIPNSPIVLDDDLNPTIKEEPEEDNSSVICEIDANNSTSQPITRENMINGIDQNIEPQNIEVDEFSQQSDNSLTQASVFNDVIHNNIHDKNKIEADVVDGVNTLESSIDGTNDNMLESKNSNNVLGNKKHIVKCKICNQSFFGRLKLRAHMRLWARNLKMAMAHKKLYESNNTGLDYFSEIAYITHCTICDHIFVGSANVVTKHKNRHEYKIKRIKKEQYKCDICNKVVSSSLILEKHMESHEIENIEAREEQHKCDICNEVVSSSLILEDHIRSHEMENIQAREEQHECDICNEVVSSSLILEKHMESHEMEIIHAREEQLKCDICNEVVSSSLILEDHKKSHEMENIQASEEQYKCNICNEVVSSLLILEKHMESHEMEIIHAREEQHKSDICNEVVSSSLILEDHMKSHEMENIQASEEQYKCNICNEVVSSSLILEKHMESHEMETNQAMKEQYKCDICNEVVSSLLILEKHMESHEMETNQAMKEQYKCDICSKVMCSSSILKKHMRIHAKVIQECDICDEKFNSELALIQHVKNQHDNNVENSHTTYVHEEINNMSSMLYKKFYSSVESLECKMCKLSFKTASDLKLHIRNHLDCTVKYHCDICNYKYSNLQALNQHKKLHSDGLQ